MLIKPIKTATINLTTIYCRSKTLHVAPLGKCITKEFLGAWFVLIRYNFCGAWVLYRASCLNANLFSPTLISLLLWTISSLPRFVKMKRPVIFCCCESYISNLQCVKTVKGNIDKQAVCIFSIRQVAFKWTLETNEKRQNFAQLWCFLGYYTSFTHVWHLNCCFWLHYCAMVTFCYFW